MTDKEIEKLSQHFRLTIWHYSKVMNCSATKAEEFFMPSLTSLYGIDLANKIARNS